MAIERFRLVSAAHLFLIRDGKVLLLRRFNTGYEDGKYSVIAGHLEGGEEVKAAAIREAREEVGIEISPSDLQVVGVMHRKSNDERVDFFLRLCGQARSRTGNPIGAISWLGLILKGFLRTWFHTLEEPSIITVAEIGSTVLDGDSCGCAVA